MLCLVVWYLGLKQLRVVFQQKVETRVQVDAQRVQMLLSPHQQLVN
jgi:hypothetical protein